MELQIWQVPKLASDVKYLPYIVNDTKSGTIDALLQSLEGGEYCAKRQKDLKSQHRVPVSCFPLSVFDILGRKVAGSQRHDHSHRAPP